jgi:hypothetical protein
MSGLHAGRLSSSVVGRASAVMRACRRAAGSFLTDVAAATARSRNRATPGTGQGLRYFAIKNGRCARAL